ncbi:isochorismatase family cysteine hydrolase [Salinibacterium sp. TMP30]|uniref:cysteine hydrolase family protein n=1 Tax=Salinibacterium sp. TMP30 TaxID=3138237 RepID=UPI0031388201
MGEVIQMSPELSAVDTALVVIDMQNGFCHPDGSIAQTMPIDANSKVVPVVAGLVSAAHAAGMTVFWSIQEHIANDVSIDRSWLDNPQAELLVPPCLRGSWDSELLDDLSPLVHENDVKIVKHRASAFYGTGLEVELRMRGITHLVICGVTTSYCVDGTVRDAYSRDLGVTVVEDACGTPWPDLHAATMKNISLFHGTVTTSAVVTSALSTIRS